MRVLIIGAGVAGSTLALFLHRAGVDCAVYEAAQAGGSGAALALAANGLAVLDAAGVLDELVPLSVRARDWAFENQSGGTLARIRDARRGSRYQTRLIARPVLQRVLEDRLRLQGIAINYAKRLERLEDTPGGPLLAHFADGTTAAGDCLIGADGIGSQVRRAILPEIPAPRYTGLMAPGGFSPLPAGETVRADSEQRVHLIFGRDCFFEYINVVTPEGPRSLWWSTSEAPLVSRAELAARSPEEHKRSLLALHQHWSAPVQAMIASAEKIIPLAIHDFPVLDRWSAGRVLLIGDAAHAVGPHSGQASSMALEDAMLLGARLGAANGASLQQIFTGFEADRRPRMDRVLALGKRAEERKAEMTAAKYWFLQQQMRLRVPLGSLKSKKWLLDYRVSSTAGSALQEAAPTRA